MIDDSVDTGSSAAGQRAAPDAGFTGERLSLDSASEEAKLWSDFAESGSSASYCRAWLALQCRTIPNVSAALLLLEDDETFAPAAIWPDERRDVSYLKEAAEKALTQRTGVVLRMEAGTLPSVPGLTGVQVAYPVIVRGTLYGVVVVHVLLGKNADLQTVLRQLYWGAGWLEALFWRVRSQDDKTRVERAAIALDVLAVIQENTKLKAAAIAFVNELVTRLRCDRVAFGLKHGNGVKLHAISHATKIERKAGFVDGLENAMDEALDQNASVSHPALPTTSRRVSVALSSFAKANGFAAAASVSMSARGKPLSVITFLKKAGDAFDADDLRLAEAVAALAGPVFDDKRRDDRWIAGRFADAGAFLMRSLFGQRHPSLKLAALALVAGITFLYFATGTFQISAKAVLEGAIQRAAVAPFDGFIAQAEKRAGDTVQSGDVLATLDDKDLMLDRLKWQSEKDKALQKMREASAEHDRAAIATASAQVRQAEAQFAQTEEKLSRTRITAPFDGFVVSGDLSQTLGSPVERGKVLFEIAPLASYRVILQVDERDIQYLELGQTGTLILTGAPGSAFHLTVSKIISVATADEGRNYFRVEAALDGNEDQLRPGMEGIGKLKIGERKLLWIWTRSLIDWLKLTWWTWKP